jgi:hypothetical protein
VTVEELVRLALRGAMVEGTPSERIPLGSPVPANLEARLQTAAARVLMESSAGLRESWLRQAADRPVPPPTPGFESGVNPEPEPTPDPSTDAPAADPLPLRSVGEARWTAEPDSAAVLPAGAAPVTSSRDGGQHPGSGDAQGRPRPRAAAPIAVDAALHAASARLSAADLASRVSELAQRPPVETPEPPAPEPTVDGEPLNHAVVRSLKFQWTQGGGEARLQLRPEYLGDLTVSLRVSGASVTAILSADSASVRSWIDAHQSDLRRALEAQGLSLDSLIIDPDGHGQERQESSGQQEHRAPYRRRHEAGRFEALL